jgi:hypothetical protein
LPKLQDGILLTLLHHLVPSSFATRSDLINVDFSLNEISTLDARLLDGFGVDGGAV